MTELTIRPEEIRDALDSFVQSYEPGATSREEVGRVSEAGDGIARVEGLPSVMANELLRFEDGTLGLALNLDVREIGVVVLGEFSGIEEGQEVHRTGEVLSVPVGDEFLGRVVDPLAQPIDGLGDITPETRRALELQAPSVVQRKSVHEPLQTGIKAIDSMTPIGRGQRQLIIGDRQTGKTAVAIDTIINQKEFWDSGDPTKQVRCIYVAIGQKGSTIASVRAALEQALALLPQDFGTDRANDILAVARALLKKNLSGRTPRGVCTYFSLVTRLTVDSCMLITSATSRRVSGLRYSMPFSKKSRCRSTMKFITLSMVCRRCSIA